MTFGKFFGLGFLLAILLAALKIFYIQIFNDQSQFIQFGFWFFIILITIACVRRVGVINFLESFLICGFWFVIALFFDFMITSQIAGFDMFKRLDIWLGYVIMVLSIFLFHKKRHIQIRREHAAHGGHH